MDLVGICHMVDTPSSGKCEFNYIYVVGLILYILIHFESGLFDSVYIGFLSLLVFLQCSCFDMVIVPRVLACVILFLLCFLRYKVFCFQWICVVSDPAFGICR